ncbi:MULTISPECIES: GNAT family N-acetyltransferase [Paenibacillus]|nr:MULTISPECIES: GNAT family N-acetyltransferase [Paenibacillus]
MSEQPVIRNIPKEQFQESMDLSAFAFQYVLTEEDRYHREALMRTEELWGAYVDGRLAAKLTIHGFETWMHGKKFALGGIAGVATWPEYRRGGLVTKLLAHALMTMKEQGQTLSFLYPFQFPFYRKFGWEMCAEQKIYDIPAALLPHWPAGTGKIVRTGGQRELLEPVYTAYAERYNGMLVREEGWWEHRVFRNKPGTAAVYYDSSGRAAGYVMYQVKERVLKVHELVYLDHQARTALWRFLADHDSMIDRLTLSAPAEDDLAFLLDHPRIKQELSPTFMARIVDVPAFLAKFPFASGVESTLLLRVEDTHAAWNNGVWRLSVDESGTAVVREADSASSGCLPFASCSIQTLAVLMLGYRRPALLHEIGRLQGTAEAVETLERLIPPRPVYLADYF